MARITVEDCLKKEGNRFALVLLAARRTKQILEGAKPLLEIVKNKSVVNSLREVATGQVRFMTDEDKARVEEKERLLKEEALARAAQVVAVDEKESIFITKVEDSDESGSDSSEDEEKSEGSDEVLSEEPDSEGGESSPDEGEIKEEF